MCTYSHDYNGMQQGGRARQNNYPNPNYPNTGGRGGYQNHNQQGGGGRGYPNQNTHGGGGNFPNNVPDHYNTGGTMGGRGGRGTSQPNNVDLQANDVSF